MVILFFGANFDGDLPGWFCYLMGILYFTYMLADNCDGKQARRTGSSSPLGMLFDHGVDSTTSILGNFTMQRLLKSGILSSIIS